VRPGNDQELQRFDETTSAVLRAQYALAERFVNGVRIGVLGALAIASAFYSPFLTPELNRANILVLTPVLLWAMAQHFAFHAPGKTWRHLSVANALIDITAVSAIVT
jgi:hypothetical protein